MTVLDRSELEASSLADLHLIADQIGLEGFRRLRKADLIDAILGERAEGGGDDDAVFEEGEERPRTRRGRSRSRSRRDTTKSDAEDEQDNEKPESSDEDADEESAPRRGRDRSERGRQREPRRRESGPRESVPREPDPVREGVVEILGNGSALLRVQPPDASDEDVYVSAAQVRRCELVPGDRVSGPVRPPRRSERHPSLVRVDTINGAPADSVVAEGTRYDELAVAYPSEHLVLGSEDPTLKAIEWLTPIGRGSRVVIAGGERAGKTEALRRILGALTGREGLELSLVLAGARPEEIAEWQEGPLTPAATLSFAASTDAQGLAVEAAVETAKRLAARGADAVVLIDTLAGLHPHSARKALAAARNLKEGGSLTVIATAAHSLGGETTVIALDPLLAGTGRFPALDLVHSGTLRPELLVGEDGAEAIARARQESR
ncbi:MAG TPA: Rho termination factor N-terminal domain-containing protein [Solirubrobacteraceae bacterium]|jgi:transcription termination factor Rho|nr:Rho termination factor N-terminal domain-containing protein [Solirubrobacteraceae bacterium]